MTKESKTLYLVPTTKVTEIKLRRHILQGSYSTTEGFGRYGEGFERQEGIDLDTY